LRAAGLTDELGYTHVRQVEHYFKPYGGYSPNPLIFLTAVAQRTTKVRLITGAVLPAFNSPLKMAGEIGMLDGISAASPRVWCKSRCSWRTRMSRRRASSTATTVDPEVIAIPLEPDKMRSLIDTYREAWRAAGHPGTARPLRWPLHGARPVAIASSRVGAHMKNVFMIWPLRGDGCAARKAWPLQKSRCRNFKLTHYPVMNRIDPELFNACFSSWLAEC
jgi:hypothetical protein